MEFFHLNWWKCVNAQCGVLHSAHQVNQMNRQSAGVTGVNWMEVKWHLGGPLACKSAVTWQSKVNISASTRLSVAIETSNWSFTNFSAFFSSKFDFFKLKNCSKEELNSFLKIAHFILIEFDLNGYRSIALDEFYRRSFECNSIRVGVRSQSAKMQISRKMAPAT